MYSWSVRAKNASGYSDWANNWNFSTSVLIPTLVYPLNGSIGVLTSVEFKWTAVNAATSLIYTLQVATEPNFRDGPREFSGMTGTTKLVTGLQNKILHFWRVGAMVNGSIVWSATWSFRTAGALIAVDQSILKFDSIVVGRTQSKTFNIINTGTENLIISRMAITGSDAGNFNSSDIIPTVINIPMGGRKSVTVNFAPLLSGGYECEIGDIS